MANARLDVYLHGTGGNGSSNESITGATVIETKTPQTSEGAVSKRQLKGMAVATMIASGSLNYVTSNVGRYTGNSHNQQVVNNVQQGFQYAAMFAINPYLAIGTLAVGGIQYALDENWRRKTENVSLSQAQARAGYSSSSDVVSRRNR